MLAPDDPPLAAALAAAAVSTSHARLTTTLALAARRATSSPLSFLRTAALNDVSRQVLVLAADSEGRDMLRAVLAEDDGLAAAVAAAAVSPLRVAAEGSVTPTPDVTATEDGRAVSSAEVDAASRALEGVCLASPGARAAAVAAGAPAALAAALHKAGAPHHVKSLLHAAGAVLIDGPDAVAAFSSGGGVRAAARAPRPAVAARPVGARGPPSCACCCSISRPPRVLTPTRCERMWMACWALARATRWRRGGAVRGRFVFVSLCLFVGASVSFHWVCKAVKRKN